MFTFSLRRRGPWQDLPWYTVPGNTKADVKHDLRGSGKQEQRGNIGKDKRL